MKKFGVYSVSKELINSSKSRSIIPLSRVSGPGLSGMKTTALSSPNPESGVGGQNREIVLTLVLSSL